MLCLSMPRVWKQRRRGVNPAVREHVRRRVAIVVVIEMRRGVIAGGEVAMIVEMTGDVIAGEGVATSEEE